MRVTVNVRFGGAMILEEVDGGSPEALATVLVSGIPRRSAGGTRTPEHTSRRFIA